MSRRKIRSDRNLFKPEIIHKIIEEVKQRSLLWDSYDDNYNNRQMIASAWEDISKQLDIPENVVRIRWKNLRDTFIRDVRRLKISNVDDYVGKWKYFKQLWFLHKDNEKDEINTFVAPPEDSIVKIERADTSEFDYEAEIQRIPIHSDFNRSVLTSASPDSDYDLMFLKSLTPYLQQIDPLRKLHLRNRIQDMILKEWTLQMSN